MGLIIDTETPFQELAGVVLVCSVPPSGNRLIGESTIAEEGFWHGDIQSTATARVVIQIEDGDGGAWSGGGWLSKKKKKKLGI
ncbi:hypothetical protein Q3G72_022950 [Acer saccharum]|nr:hypothetical protein Q3G72_022950 [Acer saccharum]